MQICQVLFTMLVLRDTSYLNASVETSQFAFSLLCILLWKRIQVSLLKILNGCWDDKWITSPSATCPDFIRVWYCCSYWKISALVHKRHHYELQHIRKAIINYLLNRVCRGHLGVFNKDCYYLHKSFPLSTFRSMDIP